MSLGSTFLVPSGKGRWETEEKDEKPMRVGRLERVKPTFLLTDTPEHGPLGHPGLYWAKVHGRRQDPGPVVTGRGSTLEG
jgi:hypothetical protein